MDKGARFPAVFIGTVYLVACAVLMGSIGDSGFGLFEILATFLIALPIVGGAWIGRQFETEWVSILFYVAVIGVGIWGYYEIWRVFYVLPSDPQSAIALVIGPFYQTVLVLGAAGISFIVDRWARNR
uniref:hypothetical protein n=1 Tax=uncultured Altererythrobacter sp. TaxID=500840 RepID=UPI002620C21A|nr:hypothetical protein [uncultured Altererythrobacter sp.]